MVLTLKTVHVHISQASHTRSRFDVRRSCSQASRLCMPAATEANPSASVALSVGVVCLLVCQGLLSRPLVSSGCPSVGQAMVECHCCRSKMLCKQQTVIKRPTPAACISVCSCGVRKYVHRRHGSVLDRVIAVVSPKEALLGHDPKP